MLESAVCTVFAMPELVLVLSAHLDPQALARCTRVCKDWSRQFEHILWSNLLLKRHRCESLSDTPASQMKAALSRNLALIRTMRIECATITLLQVLTQGSTTDPYLPTVLDLNHRLTHLELLFDLVENDAVLASISRLANLERLSLSSELLLSLDVIWCDPDQDVLDLKAVIKRASRARFSRNPSAIKIKTLQLPRKGRHNPLPLLLLQSKLLDLESCEIPWFDWNTDPTELTQVVRKHCPNLKHLICPSFWDKELDGHRVDSFILGCTQLQSFVSYGFCDDEPETEPRHIISTLASQHCNTLEVLELTECDQVSSRDQQAILSRCKRLKQFWVMSSGLDKTDIGIESTDIRTEDWVCMELTKLGLTLNRFPMMENVLGELTEAAGPVVEMEGGPDAETRAIDAKRVYTQIGRLSKLEILELDVVANELTNAEEGDYAWDLTLSKGWLGEMAGLKNLKSLRLEADLWSEMGQAEIEFIHEHWPLLRENSLRGSSLQLSPESPWRWLLNKRPQLRLDIMQ